MRVRTKGRMRIVRWLGVGGAIGAGVLFGLSDPASAATTASFSSGTLTVFGDNLDNTVTISRNASGALLVNDGAVVVNGGTPTVANTALIEVFGQGGRDTITLNEALGALPSANLFGGAGNDVLTGGSGGDQLFGDSGNDTLLGKGGFDFLFGGRDQDTLTGGDADDKVFGEGGNDRMIWNPGDDTDLNEGGAGNDTVEVNGGNGAEVFTTTATGPRVRFDRLEPAAFAIDIGTSEAVVLNANGGDDTFSATGDLAALIKVTVDGGLGNDTIVGTNGADQLLGGDGDDFVDGQQGNDVAFLGANTDTFNWDPGDGNDTIEGQDGIDTMHFNGSAGPEVFTASANGGRLRFTRSLGTSVTDTNDVEAVDLQALGGIDTLTVNDLKGTDVTSINSDLAGEIGGTTGDGQADTIIVNGTSGGDVIDVAGSGTSASVLGLQAQVNITNTEAANDSLVVNTLGGADRVTATALPANVIKLTIDGGAANDTLRGSQGSDVFLGGSGNDFTFGDSGDDIAWMGSNDDVFEWNPGDGNDTFEGELGNDKMLFAGANIDEKIDIVANGGRVRFLRNIATVVMDLNDVEGVDFRALGGADNVTVGDLSGTDLIDTSLDLSGPNGGGDGAADTVTATGTNGPDAFRASGDAGGVNVTGLHNRINVLFPEQANDRLTLNGLDGDDDIDASSLAANGIQLTMDGGLGVDTLRGGGGGDLLNGGDGNDVAFMGGGDDTFAWNPGDDNDTLEGQDGFDTMLFNGAGVSEQIDISGNGERVRFFRDIANVLMDLDDVERIDVNALGGSDKVTVNDLSGTAVVEVNANLAGPGGVGDAEVDNIVVAGTNGDDVALVVGDASGTSVLGLAAQLNITGAESANDRLTVNALDGADVVEGSGLAIGAIQFKADGGNGDDVLVGGDGNDELLGGNGDDVLVGGPGVDTLDGGPDDDTVIQLVPSGVATAEADVVTSAQAADDAWLARHVAVVDGKKVIDIAGKKVLVKDARVTS